MDPKLSERCAAEAASEILTLRARVAELEAELAKPIEPIGTGLINEVLNQRDRYRKALVQIRDRIHEHDENTWAMRTIAVEALKN